MKWTENEMVTEMVNDVVPAVSLGEPLSVELARNTIPSPYINFQSSPLNRNNTRLSDLEHSTRVEINQELPIIVFR